MNARVDWTRPGEALDLLAMRHPDADREHLAMAVVLATLESPSSRRVQDEFRRRYAQSSTELLATLKEHLLVLRAVATEASILLHVDRISQRLHDQGEDLTLLDQRSDKATKPTTHTPTPPNGPA